MATLLSRRRQPELPSAVRIGAIDHAVVFVDELCGSNGALYGDIDYGRCRIRVSAEENEQVQRVTLWHEVLHGLLHAAGVMEEHDEETIRILSHGIVQVLRDNPAMRETGH